MSNKENGNSSPGSGGGNSSTGQSNSGGASSEAHQYVGPYRLEKTLGKGQTGKVTAIIIRLYKRMHT